MPKFAVLLCRFVKHVLLHRRQNTEVPLQALVVVVSDVVSIILTRLSRSVNRLP